MTVIAVSIGQVFHAVPDAAGGLPLDDYASILAILDRNLCPTVALFIHMLVPHRSMLTCAP